MEMVDWMCYHNIRMEHSQNKTDQIESIVVVVDQSCWGKNAVRYFDKCPDG